MIKENKEFEEAILKHLKEKGLDLAKIKIPLGIPGLNATLDLELVSTVTISADFGLSVGNTTNIVVTAFIKHTCFHNCTGSNYPDNITVYKSFCC